MRSSGAGVVAGLAALVALVFVRGFAAAPGLVTYATDSDADVDLPERAVLQSWGGEVAFVNRIEPRTVQVGGGGLLPSLVTAQVFTDVTLQTPSGTHPLPRDAEHREPDDPRDDQARAGPGADDRERARARGRVDDHGGEVYVYRRTGQACHVCGTRVRTDLLQGRNVFWCPKCQKKFRSRAVGSQRGDS